MSQIATLVVPMFAALVEWSCPWPLLAPSSHTLAAFSSGNRPLSLVFCLRRSACSTLSSCRLPRAALDSVRPATDGGRRSIPKTGENEQIKA